MNKEQLLEQLRILRDHLPQGKLDSARISTEEEIAILENKLADDSNYETYNSRFFNNGRISNLEKSKDTAHRNLVSAENKINELEKALSIAEKEIGNNSSRIEAIDTRLRILGVELRSVGELTPDKVEEMEELRNEKAEKNKYIAELRGNIAEYNKDIETNKQSVEEYKAREQRYQTLLDEFNSRVKRESENINVVQKMKDEAELNKLRERKESLESNFEYSNMDFGEELEDIINSLNDDSMSIEEAIGHLNEYKQQNMSATTIANLYEKREEEKSSLEQAKSNLSAEIADLETKLSDDANYYVSGFVTEVNDDRIAKAEQNMAKIEADIHEIDESIAHYDNELKRIDNQILFAEGVIATLNEGIKKNKVLLESLVPGRDDTLIASISRRIAEHETEIEYQNMFINSYKDEYNTFKQQKEAAMASRNIKEDRLVRYADIIPNMEEQNKNEIDNYKKRLDEDRLAKLKQNMDAINSRLAFLDYDFASELDAIIANKMVAPAPAPNSEEAKEPENQEIENEKLPEEEKALEEVPFGTYQIVSLEPASEELKQNVKKRKLLDKFKEKLKKFGNNFEANWKKWIATVGVTALMAATVLGGKKLVDHLTQNSEKDDLDKLNNEAVIEAQIQEDEEKTLDQEVAEAIKDVTDSVKDHKKSNEDIAREVIAGKWGNGEERRKKLTEAGYDYKAIQDIVDKLLKGTGVKQPSNTNGVKENEAQQDVVQEIPNVRSVEEQVVSQIEVLPSGYEKKEDGTIVEQKEEVVEGFDSNGNYVDDKGVVHETKPDTSIQPGVVVSGGEEQSSVTEEVSNTSVTQPIGTTTNDKQNETTGGQQIGSTVEETILDTGKKEETENKGLETTGQEVISVKEETVSDTGKKQETENKGLETTGQEVISVKEETVSDTGKKQETEDKGASTVQQTDADKTNTSVSTNENGEDRKIISQTTVISGGEKTNQEETIVQDNVVKPNERAEAQNQEIQDKDNKNQETQDKDSKGQETQDQNQEQNNKGQGQNATGSNSEGQNATGSNSEGQNTGVIEEEVDNEVVLPDGYTLEDLFKAYEAEKAAEQSSQEETITLSDGTFVTIDYSTPANGELEQSNSAFDEEKSEDNTLLQNSESPEVIDNGVEGDESQDLNELLETLNLNSLEQDVEKSQGGM